MLNSIIGVKSDKIRCVECHIKQWHVRVDGPKWETFTVDDSHNRPKYRRCEVCLKPTSQGNAFGATNVEKATQHKVTRLLLKDIDGNFIQIVASPKTTTRQVEYTERDTQERFSRLEL